MLLHVEALFTRDASGRLLAANEPGGGRAPRFFLGRTSDGNECWVRHDVDGILARDLNTLCESAPGELETDTNPRTAAPFLSRLEDDEPINNIWKGPVYCFRPTYQATTTPSASPLTMRRYSSLTSRTGCPTSRLAYHSPRSWRTGGPFQSAVACESPRELMSLELKRTPTSADEAML